MEIDNIIEIGIDNSERLYIKPENEKFTQIYRTATEVHWDNDGCYLYSPKPKDWTYLQWYIFPKCFFSNYQFTITIFNNIYDMIIPLQERMLEMNFNI